MIHSLLRALDHYARKELVPRLANNPLFQSFVVHTNSKLKEIQDETQKKASLTFQQAGAKNKYVYKGMVHYRKAREALEDLQERVQNGDMFERTDPADRVEGPTKKGRGQR
mmetsp:Transcript_33764/g.95028  ORF Transcript_33764/g.95028 Transcript_33764/m.95028 type:complete len:111 (+) Transcript_33764:132-464(+)